MPVIVNKTARAVTLSHRCDGLIHKLVLNPGINEISDSDEKLFNSCEYISTLKKAKKIATAKSVADIDDDDLPMAEVRSTSQALSPAMIAAEKELAERERIAAGEKKLAAAKK